MKTETQRKYPIGGFAPGNYNCNCVTCKTQFIGDKRAVQCEICAIEGSLSNKELHPHWKAVGLIFDFYIMGVTFHKAKDCALVTCKEVIAEIDKYDRDLVILGCSRKYWHQVKRQIEEMKQ